MHGKEKQAGCRLTDVMHIEVLRHRAGHRKLEKRTTQAKGGASAHVNTSFPMLTKVTVKVAVSDLKELPNTCH